MGSNEPKANRWTMAEVSVCELYLYLARERSDRSCDDMVASNNLSKVDCWVSYFISNHCLTMLLSLIQNRFWFQRWWYCVLSHTPFLSFFQLATAEKDAAFILLILCSFDSSQWELSNGSLRIHFQFPRAVELDLHGTKNGLFEADSDDLFEGCDCKIIVILDAFDMFNR